MTRNCTQKNAAVSFILMASSANLVLAGKSRMSRMPAALVLPSEASLAAVVAKPHAQIKQQNQLRYSDSITESAT